MESAGYAALEVVPTFKGLQRNLERGSSKALTAAGSAGGDKFGQSAAGAAKKRFKGAAKSIVAPLLGAFAAVKVGDFLRDSISEARESQKVGALTAQVIESTGSAAKVTADQVGALSTAISNKTGLDDEAVQRGANLILTFKGIRNEAGKGNKIFNRTTQAVTDMAAAMAGGSGEIDLKAASIQVGKALNDPVKGVTALSKVGVSFSKQQKAVIKALVEGGDANAAIALGLVDSTGTFNNLIKQQHGDVAKTVNLLTKDLTPAQQKLYDKYTEGGHTLQAQKMILRELNSEFGGAAAAQATTGEKVATAFNNIKESVGTALLPAIESVEQAFLKKGVPALQQFVGWAQDKAIPAIERFGKKAAPVVRDVLAKTRDILKEAKPYAEGFVKAFNKLPKSAKTGIGATALLGFGASKVPGVKGLLGGGGGAAKGILGLVTKAKPMPVFVVNNGVGGAGGGGLGGFGKGAAAGGAAGEAATGGRLARAGRFAARGAIAFPLPALGSKVITPEERASHGMKMLTPDQVEKFKSVNDYAARARQNIDKLPGSLERGKNGAQALASEVTGVSRSAGRAKSSVVDLLGALEKARQKAVKVEQGVSAARTATVDARLARGGVTVIHNGDIKSDSPRDYLRNTQRVSRHKAAGGRMP